MKIVIDIPDEAYELLKSKQVLDNIAESIIANGTPLPKGHGELIDKDVVLDMMNHGILKDYITTMGGVIPADR